MKCCEYNPRDIIHKMSHELLKINIWDGVQTLITLSLKDYTGTITFYSEAILKVTKKIKCCEYSNDVSK
jgi:hypothetical protein